MINNGKQGWQISPTASTTSNDTVNASSACTPHTHRSSTNKSHNSSRNVEAKRDRPLIAGAPNEAPA